MCVILFMGSFALVGVVHDVFKIQDNVLSERSVVKNEAIPSHDQEREGAVKGERVGMLDKKYQTIFDVFADEEYLNIQESLMKEPRLEIDAQYEIAYNALVPLQNIRVYAIPTGRLTTIVWDTVWPPPDKILIYRSEDPSYTGDVLGEVPGTETRFHDTAVVLGATYYYALQSFVGSISSHVSAVYKAGPIDDSVPPDPPQGVSLEEKDNEGILIQWKDADDIDLAFVNIYRSDEEGVIGRNIAQVAPKEEKFLDTHVEKNSVYYYYLTSEDMARNESSVSLLQKNRIGNENPFLPFFVENIP